MKLKFFDKTHLGSDRNESMLFSFLGTIAESDQQGSLCPWTQGFTPMKK